MLLDYIRQRQKMLKESNNFYTANGIHVFTKDQMMNDIVDLESVVAKLESLLPDHIRDGVEMVIVGEFDEFIERDINAFYDSGAIFITNEQDDDQDMIDDIIHEIAHAVEERYNDFIYSDSSIEREFMAKRETLFNLCQSYDLHPPKSMLVNSDFDQVIDDYLYLEVGYDVINDLVNGLFISAYAATSLSEYYARTFEEWVFGHRDQVRKLSPALYNIFEDLFEED